MIAERFENQSGIINPSVLASKEFTVIGAGAIGSFLVPTLAKMGAEKITVYDDDRIEEHNIANQFYPTIDMGAAKVDALRNMAASHSGVLIETRQERWNIGNGLSEVVICCVDNMETRKDLFAAACNNAVVRYFIDGRMGAQLIRCYCVDLQDDRQRELYGRTLYSDSQATQDRCTEKSIIYTGLIVAGLMLNLIKRAINGEQRPVEQVWDCVTSTHVVTYL